MRDREAAGVESREVEQVGRQLRQPLHLLAHRVEELAALGLGQAALGEQLEVAAERGERRAQLVRGVRDERGSARARARRGACASPPASAPARRSRRACGRRSALRTSRARCARRRPAGARGAPPRAGSARRPASSATPKASAPPNTRRRSTAETCSWTSRSGASTSTTPSTPWLETLNVSSAVRPPGRFSTVAVSRCRLALSSTTASAFRERGARRVRGGGLQLEPVLGEDRDPRPADRRREALELHGGELRLAERRQQELGLRRLHARAQRGDARLLEVVLQRGQHERREHHQREQRRGRSDHREPHAQAAGALQRLADHAPKRYPTPRTVRISCGAEGSRSSFSRRCRMWTSIVRCSR